MVRTDKVVACALCGGLYNTEGKSLDGASPRCSCEKPFITCSAEIKEVFKLHRRFVDRLTRVEDRLEHLRVRLYDED